MTILLLLAAAATQPRAATPRAFLERAYASYRNPHFSPFDHLDLYFAPRLIAAIREDARLAHGEVGYVDGDPICQCQDPAGMHPSVVEVTPRGRDRASVRVSIRWRHDKPTAARFSLVRTSAGWRIADVSSSGEPSLLDAIEKSNSAARATRKPH